ncbi:hypothetical protein U1839_26390 [Sphingomonas sp. RT2P30]|uniref:hypothetical protein n=1 Tax=Parasphingomonas halimpatiens TaxID=3096162 RepID=UPI002FC7AF9C
MSEQPEPGVSDPIFDSDTPVGGVGLCLSGGGYRAMLFHVGAVWRLVDAEKLRMLEVVGSLAKHERESAFWSARTDIADYKLTDTLPCPHDQTNKLAATSTRLRQMDETRQERLVNWGYAVADAGIRRYWTKSVKAPTAFSYPASGVG